MSGAGIDRLLRGHAAAVLLFLYVPIALVVLFSFNAGERTGELRGLSGRWYLAVFEDRFALAALGNSLVVAAWTALIATTFGTLAGLAIGRLPPAARAVFEALTFVAIIIPGIVIAIATLLFFVNLFGWLNPWLTYVGSVLGWEVPKVGAGLHTIVAAHVLFTMAIVIVLVRTRLAGMDRTLIEASADLYAGPWRTLRQVTLPLIRPAILGGALLSFTFSWDDFIIAQFVAGPGQNTLPMYVFASIRRGITPEINAIAAMVLGVTLGVLALAWVTYTRLSTSGRRSPSGVDAPPVAG